MSTYHTPVLLEESVEAMAIVPNGVYVDLTFGGGGHSAYIMKSMQKGKLYSFDQDEAAQKNVATVNALANEDKKFDFIEGNFRYFSNFIYAKGEKQVDAILADLGVSSHQFDEGDRGFSIRYEGDLDMRMDTNGELTAKKVINEYSEKQLLHIFKDYSELDYPQKWAATVIRARALKTINTTRELIEVVRPILKKGKDNQQLAQLFQGLRIEVNQELEVLKEMLLQTSSILKKGGRLVVIAYHSLEDRLVKNYLKKGKFEGEVDKDFYGNEIKPMDLLGNKIFTPTEEEIARNPRARSAKMRIGIKR